MIGKILAFLSALFRAFTAWQDSRQRDADRKAGKDSATVNMQWEVIERAKKARDIRNRHRSGVLPETREGDHQ